MARMLPKKMTVEEAITMCMNEMCDVPENTKTERELQLCYEEHEKNKAEMAKLIAQRVAEEMEIAWNEHDWDEYFKDLEEEADTAECIRQYFEDDSDSQEYIIPEELTNSNSKSKRAKRRKQKARHKQHVRRNAVNAAKNMPKRSQDDMMYTSCRGGFIINNPKSKSLRTAHLWKRAEKMKLVDNNTVID